jgi:G2/mitotic-specific cyclin 3/4
MQHLPRADMMKFQTELDWGMRRTMMEWIIQVHAQFRLLPETLHLTINLIDRTLSTKFVSVNKLQLVGVASFLIACKYEEIMAPSVDDLVYITDKEYQSSEIIRAERHMLGILGYQVFCC